MRVMIVVSGSLTNVEQFSLEVHVMNFHNSWIRTENASGWLEGLDKYINQLTSHYRGNQITIRRFDRSVQHVFEILLSTSGCKAIEISPINSKPVSIDPSKLLEELRESVRLPPEMVQASDDSSRAAVMLSPVSSAAPESDGNKPSDSSETSKDAEKLSTWSQHETLGWKGKPPDG